MEKYFELPKNDVQSRAQNEWFKICRNNVIPFIVLRSRTKFADVSWDYITYSPEIEKILNALNGQLRDGAIAIFNKYANSRSKYQANDLIVSFENIEIPKAKLAAEELYDLIADYVERSHRA